MVIGHKEAERQRKRRNEKSHHTEDIPEVKEDDDAPGGRCHAVRQALLKAGGERMGIGHNPRPCALRAFRSSAPEPETRLAPSASSGTRTHPTPAPAPPVGASTLRFEV